MTTQTIVNNMINKYVEVYAKAIEAGYSNQDAHALLQNSLLMDSRRWHKCHFGSHSFLQY